MATLLLACLAFPLAGILLTLGNPARAKQSALVTTLFVAVAAGFLCFAAQPAGLSFGDNLFALSFAIDALNVWLFGLTALLMPVCVLISWIAITDRPAGFYRMLLLLETAMLGVFTAQTVLWFYVFFEFTLIPLFFLIGVWGSEERQLAAKKFFIFTLFGSLFTFLGFLMLAATTGRVSIPELTGLLAARPLDPATQHWIFWLLFAGFAVKVPLFPLHTWLPLAHVQAPAAGSVLLAGVLLKIGVYGFLRFSIPMLPAATLAAMPWMLAVAACGIVYGALVSLAQRDIKRLIAYSSVSHLGFCMLGIFSLTKFGTAGGMLQMINHGLSTGALFALVGMIYERYHTRQMADLRGIAKRLPRLSAFFVFMALASIGLPGLNNFPGEFLVLLGAFQRAWQDPMPGWQTAMLVMAIASTAGVVLGAWYMLRLVRCVFFGELREPEAARKHPVRDLDARECLALAPLVFFIVWIGVQPQFFLKKLPNVPTVSIKSPSVQP